MGLLFHNSVDLAVLHHSANRKASKLPAGTQYPVDGKTAWRTETQRKAQPVSVHMHCLQGAFYVLPDMSQFFGPGVEAKEYGPVPDADALAMYLIQQAHVALVPGDAFGAPNCIRISYAASMATLKEALDRLERALQPDVFLRSSNNS